MTAAMANSYGIFQAVIITLVVLWSVTYAFRRLFPRSARALQARASAWFSASTYPRLRRVGQWLQPIQVANSAAGCGTGGGCSSCGTCATTSSAADIAQPLVFRPRAKL